MTKAIEAQGTGSKTQKTADAKQEQDSAYVNRIGRDESISAYDLRAIEQRGYISAQVIA